MQTCTWWPWLNCAKNASIQFVYKLPSGSQSDFTYYLSNRETCCSDRSSQIVCPRGFFLPKNKKYMNKYNMIVEIVSMYWVMKWRRNRKFWNCRWSAEVWPNVDKWKVSLSKLLFWNGQINVRVCCHYKVVRM